MKKLNKTFIQLYKSEFAGIIKDYNNNVHAIEENRNMNLLAIEMLQEFLNKIKKEIEEAK